MPLETASTIAQLNENNPVVGDPVAQGDDHLRLIKAVLKAQFQNLPTVFDWAVIDTRLTAIEARLTAIEATLATGVVKYLPATNDVQISGAFQSAGITSTTSLTVQGATSLQNATVNGNATVTGNATVANTITAQHYRGDDVSVSGDITAFDGS